MPAAYAYMETNAGLARLLKIALLVMALASLAMAAVSGLTYVFHLPGVSVEYRVIGTLWDLSQAVSIANMILGSVLIVIFLLWFFRSYYNLAVLEKPLRFEAGWAVGAWLMPIINFYRPLVIFRELIAYYCEIALAFPQYQGTGSANAPRLHRQVTIWFVAFWISLLLSVLGYYFGTFHNAPMHPVTVTAHAFRILPLLLFFPILSRLQVLEGVAFAAWTSQDHARREIQVAESRQRPEQRGKSATWYREEAEAKDLLRDVDPFGD